MNIEIDVATVPPRVTLLEPDDFKSFKITTRGDHGFISIDTLEQLAGARAEDEAWREQLDGMVAYARSKGWTNAAGELRAHVEHAE